MEREKAFRRVLVPLDGTTGSESILFHLASFRGAVEKVILLHVLPDLPVVTDVPAEILEPPQRMEEYLARVRSDYALGESMLIVERGDPAERIVAVCREREADLVAMATHARSGLKRLLLGSVATPVVKQLAAPVLLARRGLAPVRVFSRILVPIEDLPGTAAALAGPLRALVSGTGAEVVLLRVEPALVVADPVTGYTAMPGLRVGAGALELEELDRALEGVETRQMGMKGESAPGILDQARRLGADVIAMAVEGGLRGMASAVLERSGCPMLLRRVGS